MVILIAKSLAASLICRALKTTDEKGNKNNGKDINSGFGLCDLDCELLPQQVTKVGA